MPDETVVEKLTLRDRADIESKLGSQRAATSCRDVDGRSAGTQLAGGRGREES